MTNMLKPNRSSQRRNRRPLIYGDLTNWGLIHADSLAFMQLLPDASVDCLLTDPPYALAFGGNSWDGAGEGRYLCDPDGFQAFTMAWAGEARRILKPGAFLVAHCAPRTFHRLVAGVEDAGLEVRDQLIWAFATGVPKARKYPGGLAGGLKPGYEPILLARAPLARISGAGTPTIAGNIQTFGTGGLNVDDTRIAKPGVSNNTGGYWPSNVVFSHHDACKGGTCNPECPRPLIDQLGPAGREGLSRFYYAAKASRQERDAGCERLVAVDAPVYSGGSSRPRRNFHSTVKPLSLERWLVRLAAPRGGVVLDPFAGSGTSGCAAVLEGRQFVGIEREADYLPIARARLAHWTAQADEKAGR